MKPVRTVVALTLFVTGTFMTFRAFGNEGPQYNPNEEYQKAWPRCAPRTSRPL